MCWFTCFSHLYLPHYAFTASWNWMETECIPLASALRCVNGIFYLAWRAPNEKTIHVWLHLVTMKLDALFSTTGNTLSVRITFICRLICQTLTNPQVARLCFSIITFKRDNPIQMFITQFALSPRVFLSGFNGICIFLDRQGVVLKLFSLPTFLPVQSQASTRNTLYFTPAHPALQSHRHCLLNYEVPSHSLTQSLT